MSDEPQESPTLTDYPGVKFALAGVFSLIGAILWAVLIPSPDAPIGGAEVLALAGAGMILGGGWVGALSLLKEDGKPPDE